jgi:hypothetical protein
MAGATRERAAAHRPSKARTLAHEAEKPAARRKRA